MTSSRFCCLKFFLQTINSHSSHVGRTTPTTPPWCDPVGVLEAAQASFPVLGREGSLVMAHLVYTSPAFSNPDKIYQDIIISARQQLISAQMFMEPISSLHVSTIPELDEAGWSVDKWMCKSKISLLAEDL